MTLSRKAFDSALVAQKMGFFSRPVVWRFIYIRYLLLLLSLPVYFTGITAKYMEV